MDKLKELFKYKSFLDMIMCKSIPSTKIKDKSIKNFYNIDLSDELVYFLQNDQIDNNIEFKES